MKIDPALRESLKEYIQNSMANKKSLVTLIAPYELGDAEVAKLTSRLPLLADAIIQKEVDSELMAGVIIKFDSKMIDLSLKSELQKLQQKIYEIA